MFDGFHEFLLLLIGAVGLVSLLVTLTTKRQNLRALMIIIVYGVGFYFFFDWLKIESMTDKEKQAMPGVY